MKFASNQSNDSWRIDVDLVCDTMFFSRWEASNVRLITGASQSGHGHSFEKAFAAFDNELSDSMSHHRIVRYTLGGLECMVRSTRILVISYFGMFRDL